MAQHYRLSRRRLPRTGIKRLLVFLLVILFPIYAIYNYQLYPGISRLATATAQNEIERMIAVAFAAQLEEEADCYDDLVTIHFGTDGSVTGISCHVPRLNRARNRLLLAVLDGLAEGEDGVEVGLPLGNLLGGEAFSGRGPYIPVRILLARGAHAHMESELSTAGFNQTLYRVMFSITVEVTVMTPSRPISATVAQTYCVAETLIVGKVPEALTQINRLTEEVTEEEIDDVNDFGAQL